MIGIKQRWRTRFASPPICIDENEEMAQQGIGAHRFLLQIEENHRMLHPAVRK